MHERGELAVLLNQKLKKLYEKVRMNVERGNEWVHDSWWQTQRSTQALGFIGTIIDLR